MASSDENLPKELSQDGKVLDLKSDSEDSVPSEDGSSELHDTIQSTKPKEQTQILSEVKSFYMS
jgi:hypothetical protein